MEVPALMEAMMKPARLKMPARLESSADPNLLVPALCAHLSMNCVCVFVRGTRSVDFDEVTV